MRVAATLTLAAILLSTGCAQTPTPEVKPTLRAPECFDGTVEKGCPSWAMDTAPGKTVSHITYTDTVAIMHYTDGTSSDSPRQLSKEQYMNAKEVYVSPYSFTDYNGTKWGCIPDSTKPETYSCTSVEPVKEK